MSFSELKHPLPTNQETLKKFKPLSFHLFISDIEFQFLVLYLDLIQSLWGSIKIPLCIDATISRKTLVPWYQ